MTNCNACHVHVCTSGAFCPLCGEPLEPVAAEYDYTPPHNTYPAPSMSMAKYSLVRRLLLFFTLLGSGICVLVDWLATPGFWWSLIVIACFAYCWLAIPPLLRRGKNYGAQVVLQLVLTSFFIIAVDALTGYHGWSVTFVVPSLLCAGIIAIGVMVMFNRTNWAQYVMYQLLLGLFGFIPLVLYLTGVAQNLVMVLITTGLALASLLVTFIFGDRTVKNEFKRRFHF